MKTSITNLRIALSMSPSGDLLRTRCRNYPGLVNNTTIDWMFPWPEEALVAVANVTLRDVRLRTCTWYRNDFTFSKCPSLNLFVFLERERTPRIQRKISRTYGVRAQNGVRLYDRLSNKIAQTKLRYTETLPRLHEYVSEPFTGNERLHKFAMRSISWRYIGD